MHEKLDEFKKLKNENVVEFKNKYNLLLSELRHYKFREDSSKGFAVKQNRNSMLIMADLQKLNEILDEILQRIDTFLVESEPNEYSKLKDIINMSLKQYIFDINNYREVLNDSRFEYFGYTMASKETNSAVRARTWKKERNNTLSRMLCWSINLLSLRDMVEISYFNNYDKKHIEKYQNFIDYLTTRPNYYSYFTVDEQREYTENNRKIKKELKLKK